MILLHFLITRDQDLADSSQVWLSQMPFWSREGDESGPGNNHIRSSGLSKGQSLQNTLFSTDWDPI